jgi:hypothetical protein
MLKQLSLTGTMAVESIFLEMATGIHMEWTQPTTEPMTSSTACLGARKVPADNPMAHGAGEPCKVHQDWIYIQVEVKPAK